MTLLLSDTCGPNQLTCKNGQCVWEDYLCDGNEDLWKKCDDNSDEEEGVCSKSHLVVIIHIFISCLMLDLHTNSLQIHPLKMPHCVKWILNVKSKIPFQFLDICFKFVR